MKLRAPVLIILCFLVVLTCAACSVRDDSIVKVSIKFNVDGGTPVAEMPYASLSTSPKTEKSGYVFSGWYEDKERSKHVSFPYSTITSVTLYAGWVDIETGNADTTYVINEDGKSYTAKKLRVKTGAVVIPDKHNGLPVTQIADGFFSFNSAINCLYLGKNVSVIDDDINAVITLEECIVAGNNECYSAENGVLFDKNKKELIAFPSSKNVKEYTIGVIKVRENAFKNCKFVTTLNFSAAVISAEKIFSAESSVLSVKVDERNTEYFDDDGILYTKNPQRLIYLSANKQIGNLKVKDGTVSVEDGALNSYYLETIELPKETIYFGACDTPLLEAINIDENNDFYCSVDGILFIKNGLILYKCPQGKKGEVVVKSGPEEISAFAFENCEYITRLFLPASIKKVGNYAFQAARLLYRVDFENGSRLSTVGQGVFMYCDSLHRISLTTRIPPTCAPDIFNSLDYNIVLSVPLNAVELYRKAWNLKERNIVGECDALTEYVVDFDVNGGENVVFENNGIESVNHYQGVAIIDPPVTKKEGYAFLGWAESDNPSTIIESFPYVITKKVTLVAIFAPIE